MSETYKINIKRFDKHKEPQSIIHEYSITPGGRGTVLEALEQIKTTKDNTLTYRCGCESGVCGSCAVRVNGVEKLACKTHIKQDDFIEPLNYTTVIRDLVVDLEYESKLIKKSHAFLEEKSTEIITKEDEKLIDRQSNCILCQSCYSSCPVYEVNKDFLGPYALTRVLRYVNDKKEAKTKDKIDAIQANGVWDCTLCGNCTMVCPQFIDPKADIMNLRAKSVQAGYSDPNMQSFCDNEFNTGFDPSGGFNPSGGFDTGFNPNGF